MPDSIHQRIFLNDMRFYFTMAHGQSASIYEVQRRFYETTSFVYTSGCISKLAKLYQWSLCDTLTHAIGYMYSTFDPIGGTTGAILHSNWRQASGKHVSVCIYVFAQVASVGESQVLHLHE